MYSTVLYNECFFFRSSTSGGSGASQDLFKDPKPGTSRKQTAPISAGKKSTRKATTPGPLDKFVVAVSTPKVSTPKKRHHFEQDDDSDSSSELSSDTHGIRGFPKYQRTETTCQPGGLPTLDIDALPCSWQGVLRFCGKLAPAWMGTVNGHGQLNIDDTLQNLNSIRISRIWPIGVGCEPTVCTVHIQYLHVYCLCKCSKYCTVPLYYTVLYSTV